MGHFDNFFKSMKYAIVEISGRQFWIEIGKYYDFNRIPIELGKEIIFNRVLLFNNENDLLVGKPYLENVKIKGKVLKHLRGKKRLFIKCNLRRRHEKNKVIVKK